GGGVGGRWGRVATPSLAAAPAPPPHDPGPPPLAAPRGDARPGNIITANIRTLRSVPLVLHGKGWPDVLEIRGEVYWPRAAFTKFNADREQRGEETFANPRNATAGTLKLLDPRIVASRHLVFCAHGNGEV